MRVNVFATLRDIVGGPSVEVEVGPDPTAQELVESVVARHPALERVLLDENRDLLPHMKLFINGREVVYLAEQLQHVLHPGDTVDLFPPVGGG
jgi:MoaD family protein